MYTGVEAADAWKSATTSGSVDRAGSQVTAARQICSTPGTGHLPTPSSEVRRVLNTQCTAPKHSLVLQNVYMNVDGDIQVLMQGTNRQNKTLFTLDSLMGCHYRSNSTRLLCGGDCQYVENCKGTTQEES